MKNALFSTALGAALVLTVPAFAQTAPGGTTPSTEAPATTGTGGTTGNAMSPATGGMNSEGGFVTRQDANQMQASNLMGATVVGSDDANIGEVDDMLLDQDGRVTAVMVDIGGFLGIGEKTVAIPIDAVEFVPAAAATGTAATGAAGTGNMASAPGTTTATTTAPATTPGGATTAVPGTVAPGTATAPAGTTTGMSTANNTGMTGSGLGWDGGELQHIRVEFTRDQLQNAPEFDDQR